MAVVLHEYVTDLYQEFKDQTEAYDSVEYAFADHRMHCN